MNDIPPKDTIISDLQRKIDIAQARAASGIDHNEKRRRIARLLAPFYAEYYKTGVAKPFTPPIDPEDPRPRLAAEEAARQKAKEEEAVDQQIS